MSNWEVFKRVVWARSGGYWLFYASAVYLVVGLYCVYKDIPTIFVELAWLICLMLPFMFPPLGRWFNLNVEWDRKMLDWFKKTEYPKYLPEGLGMLQDSEKVEPTEQKKEEKPTTTYYSIGLTSDNRVSFKMGYSEITMNPQGVQNLIDQLELFKQQVMDNQPQKNNDESTS